MKKILNIQYNLYVINAVVLFYNIFVLTNIDFPVFNWLYAMSYYLLAPAMIFLIGEVLSKNKSIGRWIFLCLLSIFFGGGCEAFTPIVMIFMVLIFYKIWKESGYDFRIAIKDPRSIKIATAEIIMLLAIIIVVIAPGNYNRMADVNEFHRSQSIMEYARGFRQAIVMFFYFVSFYIPYYCVIALVAYSVFGKRIKELVEESATKKKYFFYSLALYFIYILLSVFPSFFLWGGFGIQRNYTHVVFITMLIFCFWMILWIDAQPFLSQKY